MEMLASPEFWIAVGQIILIDILLGGDNAVVIALACRRLPPEQRTKGILWGTAGAIVLRVILIFFALTLLAIPLLKIVGAILLVWIGVKLLLPEHEDGHGEIEGSDKLWGAVKTVIVADLVMSIDNVIAIAGAAEASGTGHSMALVIFGVLISIPIIVWGSQLVLKLMDRFPIIITAGGMLLGWIAGTMAVTDPAVVNPEVMKQLPKLVVSDTMRYAAGIAGALLVLALGKWFAARQKPALAAAGGGSAAAATAAAAAAIGTAPCRMLVAVDGSESSLRALRHAVGLRAGLANPGAVSLHLLNVQAPMSSDVSTFIAKSSIDEYRKDKSDEALAAARDHLKSAGIPFTEHVQVGPAGETIAAAAAAQGCDLIVMGTRGQNAASSALLGSAAHDTLEAAGVPVMLVK